MKYSIALSKITPPYLAQILYRPRLLNLLEKNRDKKLILILGQAAQGKSTLAASYVNSLKIPSAWINLDREESDPVNLFYLIVYSLQQVLKETDLSHLIPNPLRMTGSRSVLLLYTEWAQTLYNLLPSPIQIVIDGLDHLSPDANAFKFLQSLIDCAPPHIHLMLLSREIPPLSLEFQYLKMRQEALVLINEELAFNQNEVKEFFQNIRKMSFSADQLKKIFSATEGWIGGLILLAESLSRFPESMREKFISEDLPDYFKKEVFQYLTKEVFSSQTQEVQEFLIKSSLIDLIEPTFMQDFLGMENAEQILREHVRKNLFVQCLYDEKNGWLFRYHKIFKAFLMSKLKTRINEEERRSLLIKAGTLFEQRGVLENSIKYFLEAKAYPQAVPIIERLGIDLIQKGRISDLSEWLTALPHDTIQENPWLLLYRIMTERFTGGRENLVLLQKTYNLFKQHGNIRGALISLAQLIKISVRAGTQLVPIEKLIEEGETLSQQSGLNQYPYEGAILWLFIGLSRILGEGDIHKGIWACQNAYSISKQLRGINLQAYALCFSALGFVLLGEFSLADGAQKKLEQLIEKNADSAIKAIQLMVQCLLTNHRGDFVKTQILLEKLQDEIEKYGFAYMLPWILEISGYMRAAQREFPEAEKIGNQYLSTAISLENNFLKGLALRLLGLTYLYQNDFEKAKGVLDQCMSAFPSEAPSKYYLNRTKIAMGLVCYHLKEYKRGETVLREALEYFSSISSYISLAEVHFATALLLQDRAMNEDAALHLQKGFKIAEEKKYEYFYILGTKYLTKACLLTLKLKVEGAIDYAAHLLLTRLSPFAEEELESLSNHPDLEVKEEVWKIRRAVHRSKIPRLRIETLGGFQVFRGNSPIEESEWDRNQPKQLLKAIVSYGGRNIPKEILTDELWPEENPKAAERNFKTTLQRLRKSLEPSIHKEFNSSYIHLHNNLVFLDPELCQADADLFLSLLKTAEEKEKRSETKHALSLYTEAMEIYKGDFLPDEIYASWVDKRREELRAKYIELLNKIANLYERQGAFKKSIDCYKKAIQTDPLLEEPYQKLITFYFNKGMFNEAVRTYEDCKKVLKKELKTKPDSTTTSIYNKVLEKIGASRPPVRKDIRL
jgi:LuxR family maltose regulon positive regulatory protein